jgi:hypothetical protein
MASLTMKYSPSSPVSTPHQAQSRQPTASTASAASLANSSFVSRISSSGWPCSSSAASISKSMNLSTE